MDVKYVKENRITERTEMEKDKELIKSLIRTKIDLQAATKNFEQAEDELIDYYTYQIKAHQSKLDYLIKIAKISGTKIAIGTIKIAKIIVCQKALQNDS